MAEKIVKNNKHAYYKYNVDKKFEAGVMLKGSDVKSIRANRYEIQDAFVRFENGELFLWNIIFFEATESIQRRKLLLHKREIDRIKAILNNKRFHGFVLSVKFNDSQRVKFELGFGQVKKNIEKKTSEKRSSEKRMLEKSMKFENI